MLNLTGGKNQKQTLTGDITTKGSKASSLRGRIIQKGLDGFSPIVDFEETEDGIKITITDIDGPHSVIIKPGSGTGVTTEQIAQIEQNKNDIADIKRDIGDVEILLAGL